MPSVVGLARSKPEKKSAYKLLFAMTNRANKRIDRLEQKVNESIIVLTSMTSKLNFFAEAVTMNMDVTNELVDMVEDYRETHLALVAHFNGPVPRRPVIMELPAPVAFGQAVVVAAPERTVDIIGMGSHAMRHFLRTPQENRRLKVEMAKFLVPCGTPPGAPKVKAYEPCALFDALDEPEKLGPWIPECI